MTRGREGVSKSEIARKLHIGALRCTGFCEKGFDHDHLVHGIPPDLNRTMCSDRRDSRAFQAEERLGISDRRETLHLRDGVGAGSQLAAELPAFVTEIPAAVRTRRNPRVSQPPGANEVLAPLEPDIEDGDQEQPCPANSVRGQRNCRASPAFGNSFSPSRRKPEIHGKPKKDPFREDRIHNEAIVDTYGPEAQALGWYYYCAIDIVHRGEWGHVAGSGPSGRRHRHQPQSRPRTDRSRQPHPPKLLKDKEPGPR